MNKRHIHSIFYLLFLAGRRRRLRLSSLLDELEEELLFRSTAGFAVVAAAAAGCSATAGATSTMTYIRSFDG